MTAHHQQSSQSPADLKPVDATAPVDPRRRALAIGLELAKRALRAANVDELQFILVNDCRALLPFDRSMLIVHGEGRSELAATSNQPQIETRADLVKRAHTLARPLKPVDRALILMSKNLQLKDVPEKAASALQQFVEYSGCTTLMVVPLISGNNVVGHLLYEFFNESPPDEVEAITLMNMAPFFGSALTEK